MYFIHYSRVIIILFRAGLYKSAFSTYSFVKSRFASFFVLAFHVFISLVFISISYFVSISLFLNSMPSQKTLFKTIC